MGKGKFMLRMLGGYFMELWRERRTVDNAIGDLDYSVLCLDCYPCCHDGGDVSSCELVFFRFRIVILVHRFVLTFCASAVASLVALGKPFLKWNNEAGRLPRLRRSFLPPVR